MSSPQRTDNHPPGPPLDEIDPTNLIDLSIIVPLLRLNYQDLEDRRDEFLTGIGQWLRDHTQQREGGGRTRPIIADDADCAKTQDFMKEQLRKFIAPNGEVDQARKRVKQPLDQAAKAVQGFFVDGIAAPVADAMKPMEQAYTTFLQAKEARERAERERQAQLAAAEAARLVEQARRAKAAEQRNSLVEQAEQAEDEAERLRIAAQAPAREVTRVRGDLGSVGGLRTDWRWEVETLIDLVMAVAQGREPVQMLMPNEAFINPMVRPADGRRKIPGLRIYPVQKGR